MALKKGGWLCFVLLLWWATPGCKAPAKRPFTATVISQVVGQMTDVMVRDITNPPLASRFFAYTCLAGYEAIAQNNAAYKSLHGVLKNFAVATPATKIGNAQLAAILAMTRTAARLQPSGYLIAAWEKSFLDSCRTAGFDATEIDSSLAYATRISLKILAYAKADNYYKISNRPRYTPFTTEGTWSPTSPAYIAAIEPYFNTVRPLLLDTCAQFQPSPPVPFSTRKQSAFYALMQQNYNLQLTDSLRAIAAFWDCNPFAVEDDGHLLIGLKKISPGAHWMGITGIACQQQHKSFEASLQIYTTVAIGLMDGFISCWDEKYRSNRIRPETAIHQYLDVHWQPLIQTPPFPEYVSGHSVISASSATILTHFFGPQFSYTDAVEERYGLPPRHFDSFLKAAEEAGVSRFYGGIHFMDAVQNGLKQGTLVGSWTLQKLQQAGVLQR